MKTYIVIFSKDADEVNLSLQKEALNADYPDCYLKEILDYPNAEDIDFCLEEARDYGFDKVLVLLPEDDCSEFDEMLEDAASEYRLAEARSIPEQFFRINEAAPQQVQQQRTAAQPAANGQVDLIACDVNYPSRKGWQTFRSQIQNSYCVLSLTKLQGQYLNAQNMVQMLKRFPDKTIAQDAEKIFSSRGLFATFDPRQEISIANVIDELKDKMPGKAITTVVFHVANVKSGINQVRLSDGSSVNVKYVNSQPGWDSSTNATVWENLVQLSNDKANGYANLNKGIKTDKVEKQEKQGDESTDNMKYDPDKIKRLQEETQNGWLEFIQSLIETVQTHQKEGYSTPILDKKQAREYMSNLEKYYKALVKPDLDAWDSLLSEGGLDLIYKPLLNLAKDAVENAKRSSKEDKKTKDLHKKMSKSDQAAYNLVGTMQYKNIKEALGAR